MKASIIHNTNKLISSSESSWGSVRENSLVRFLEDDSYYTVGSVSKYLYVKEFQTLTDKVIKIISEPNINFGEGETIKISYKEYEIITLDFLESSEGLKVGDLVYYDEYAVKDIQTGITEMAEFWVVSTDEKGAVKQLRLKSPGRFIKDLPSQIHLKSSSAFKSPLTVKPMTKVVDSRYPIEKTIMGIENNQSNFLIKLDSSLPVGVSNGKISVEKWQALLTSNYVGPSKILKDIEFIRDFSPYLKIPLIAKNNPNPEIVYNAAILKVDKELKRLADEIAKYKNLK